VLFNEKHALNIEFLQFLFQIVGLNLNSFTRKKLFDSNLFPNLVRTQKFVRTQKLSFTKVERNEKMISSKKIYRSFSKSNKK